MECYPLMCSAIEPQLYPKIVFALMQILFSYKESTVFNCFCLGKMKIYFTENPTVHSVKLVSFDQEIAEHCQKSAF